MSFNKLHSLQNIIALSAATLIITVWSTVSFLVYQNKLLEKYASESKTSFINKKPLSLPTPTGFQPTNEVTKDWKTYKNEEYRFQYKCPATSDHKVEVRDGDGVKIPYYQEICYDDQNQIRVSISKFFDINSFTQEGKIKQLEGSSLKPIKFQVSNIDNNKIIKYQTQNNANQIEAYIAEIILENEMKYISVRGFSENYFNQILSTFEFLK